MNLFKTYRYPLIISLAHDADFFTYQNCGKAHLNFVLASRTPICLEDEGGSH